MANNRVVNIIMVMGGKLMTMAIIVMLAMMIMLMIVIVNMVMVRGHIAEGTKTGLTK